MSADQDQDRVRELRRLAGGCAEAEADGDCTEGDCPRVFLTRRHTIVVQGDLYPEQGREVQVEIPFSVFEEAARALGWRQIAGSSPRMNRTGHTPVVNR